MGTPLGLCVNCSFHITEGMVACGQRKELALAMLFSSPLLNIAVIIMSFTLLPTPMAMLRFADTIFFLLLIPVLLQRAGKIQTMPDRQTDFHDPFSSLLPPLTSAHASPDRALALRAFVNDSIRHIGALAKRVIPIVLVAGLLASILTHCIPWEVWLPQQDIMISIPKLAWLMVLLALIAALLPITMGLDILLAYSLLQLHVMPAMVMTMLFPFAGFSVVAFWSLYRTFGSGLALRFLTVISLIGIVNGWVYLLYF